MSDEAFLYNVNPKFRTWFGKQDGQTQDAIRSQWNGLDKTDGIYARQRSLLLFCSETYGYDFK